MTLENPNVAAFDVVGCPIAAAGTCAFGGRICLCFDTVSTGFLTGLAFCGCW